MNSAPVTFVLGGARSGKSTYAQSLVEGCPGPWIYIATGEPRDAEMADRISHHRAARGDGWQTIEAPIELVDALKMALALERPVLVDCLTLWLANLFAADRDVDLAGDELVSFLGQLKEAPPVVVVSNEVGQGIVPINPLARTFRDQAGVLHQKVARVSTRVIFMTAGLPAVLKG